jgi:hypothetical protein
MKGFEVGRGTLVAGAVGVVVLVGGLVVFRSPAATSYASTPGAAASLELIRLEHEVKADGLVVHGMVRNPGSGVEVDRLVAVVLLFSDQGGFLASGRAAVDRDALGPGETTTFTISNKGVTDVGRYRVSFRTGDRLVTHVDRRHGQT